MCMHSPLLVQYIIIILNAQQLPTVTCQSGDKSAVYTYLKQTTIEQPLVEGV